MTDKVGRPFLGRRPAQFFRPDVRRDVEDELAYHLEMRHRELVERGVPPGEARDAAARRFGNVAAVARECRAIDEAWYREQRRASMWMDLRQDVSYALRMLRRAPGFTAVAAATLALGIGGSTAIFSVIDAAILRPLPYPSPDRLVEILVEQPRPDGRVARFGPSREDVRVWREDGSVFSHLTCWSGTSRRVILEGPVPERVKVTDITEDYLGVYGVTPAAGRNLQPEDMPQGAAPVVLLGHAFAERRFGNARAAIGQTLRLDKTTATVVGVLPESFQRDSHVWRPLQTPPEFMKVRGSGATTYGRLHPHVSIAQAQEQLVSGSVDRSRGERIVVRSLYEEVAAGSRLTTGILAGAVAAILLIACINVAGLLLARGATRRPELSIRSALGAGRVRLVRQMLVESLVLSTAGGAAGVLLAWIALDALVANIPLSLPADAPPSINAYVFAFAAALSLATGVLFGLAPAITLSRVQASSLIARAGHRFGSALTRRGGQSLIAAEVALAIVLLAGAGLMIRSFSRLVAVDVGFDPDSVVTMEVTPVGLDAPATQRYYAELARALRQVPGVEAAGAVDQLPLGGSATKSVARVDGAGFGVDVRHYTAGYFEALGFPVTLGGLPADPDAAAGGSAAVINERAARELFPSGSPLGRQVVVLKRSYEIVAVVGDVRHKGPLFVPDPEVYLPQLGNRPLIAVVRTRQRPSALSAQLRETAQHVGPAVIVERIRRGTDWLDDRIITPKRRTVLLGLLGGMGFVLSLVGVFGMTAYTVARRTSEIGVRVALGATGRQVVADVVRDALWPIALGIVIGISGAMLATRLIAGFLFNTPAIDPVTFIAVAAAMALAGWLAAWIPSRRAASVNPVDALRAT